MDRCRSLTARIFVGEALRILTLPSKPNRRARGECRTLRAVGRAGHDQLLLGIYHMARVAAEECAAHDPSLDEEVGILVGFENANALWTDGGKHGIAVNWSAAKTRNPGPTKFAVVEPDDDMVTFKPAADTGQKVGLPQKPGNEGSGGMEVDV